MEEDNIVPSADCQTNWQIIKVIFEWKIKMHHLDNLIVIATNLQSIEFSAKESPRRTWFLSLKGSIIELKDSSVTDEKINSPRGGAARLDFIDKNNQKVLGVVTDICVILANPLRLEINLKELEEKDCIVDGHLTVYCEIQEIFEQITEKRDTRRAVQYRSREYGNPVLEPAFSCGDQLLRSDLKTLFENMRLTDVVFDVCGRQFKAHKVILSSRCPVFAAMFKHETIEKKSNRVVIQDVEPDVFHELLRFIYTGQVLLAKMDRMAVGLLAAAVKYLLDQLKIECENHLIYRMSSDSCFDILLLQDANHPVYYLRKEAINFFQFNLQKVMASIKWGEVKQKNPSLLCEIQEFLISRLNKRTK